MSMQKPKGFDSKPFSEHFKEDEPFYLLNAEVVKATSREYGEGEMVVLTIRTEDGPREFSVWGVYLVRQVKSADRADFGTWWKMGTTELPNGREAKALIPSSHEEAHPF